MLMWLYAGSPILLFVFLHAIVFTSISDVCFNSGRIDGITQGSSFVFIICGSVAGVRASLEQGINRLRLCDVSVFFILLVEEIIPE